MLAGGRTGLLARPRPSTARPSPKSREPMAQRALPSFPRLTSCCFCVPDAGCNVDDGVCGAFTGTTTTALRRMTTVFHPVSMVGEEPGTVQRDFSSDIAMTVLPTKPPHGHKKREYRKTNDYNDWYQDEFASAPPRTSANAIRKVSATLLLNDSDFPEAWAIEISRALPLP